MREFIANNRFLIIGIYLAVWVLLSFITLILYKVDKQRAIKGKWRTKEKTLLLSSWIFGSLGGLLGLYAIRHKTQHWYFVLNN